MIEYNFEVVLKTEGSSNKYGFKKKTNINIINIIRPLLRATGN